MKISEYVPVSEKIILLSGSTASRLNQPVRCRVGIVFGAIVLTCLLSCAGPGEKGMPLSTEQLEADPLIEEMVAMIETDVDPAFVYRYEKTKFVPPDGKTLLIMGQTVEAITEYTGSFSQQPMPGGWAAYWGIPSMKGVNEAATNETGSSQNHQMLVDRFPDSVLQSALWMVGRWDVLKKTGRGEYDSVLKEFSAWAKNTDRPIYLRIGYEFDGAHNQLEPKGYVKAYRRIVDMMRAEGADNIAFVWHSYASPTYKDYPLSDWYPGDDYVDWVGISLFGHMYATELNAEGDVVFNFARAHNKPVMVAESSPIHGIEQDNIDAWNTWFVNFLSLTYSKNVKAISFINEDWGRLSIAGLSEWKDARLQNNEQIHRAWFKETAKDRYLKQSPELFDQLGYVK
ncbi:MAG: glycosyl hydrolase [Gammaproteobacteria bacterium]|nr:glycosyl hydrolase [Gammaproteobacteria bacterium]